MYHIKSDKRCLRSASLIVEALEKLLDEKPFMEITVSDIQRTSGVGRSTFYRLFDNIDDVVTYSIEESLKESLAAGGDLSWDNYIEEFLRTIIERGNKLVNIVKDGRIDLLIRPIRLMLQELYKRENEASKTAAFYSTSIFTGACISAIRCWDENGRKESIEELAHIVRRFINYEEITKSIYVTDPEILK